MYLKRCFLVLITGFSLFNQCIHLACANEADDNIKRLKEIKSVTENNFENYVQKLYETRVRALYLRRIYEYDSVLTALLDMQNEVIGRAEVLNDLWKTKISNLEPYEIMEIFQELYVYKMDLENEKNILKRIETDYKEIKKYWPNRCSAEKIQWTLERNDPNKLFVVGDVAIIKPPEVTIGVQVGISSDGKDQLHRPPGLDGQKGMWGTLGTAGYSAGVGAVAAIKAGTWAVYQAAAIAAIPGGLVVGAALVGVICVIEAINASETLNEQTKLVEEIRAKQKEKVKKTADSAYRFISEICEDYMTPEYGMKLDDAIQLNQTYISKIEKIEVEFDSGWEDLRRKFSEFIKNLENNYFPNLAADAIATISRSYDALRQIDDESVTYIRDELYPLIQALKPDPLQKLEIKNKLWDKLIDGDARFSNPLGGTWESMKSKITQKYILK